MSAARQAPRTQSISSQIQGFQGKSSHFSPAEAAGTPRSLDFRENPRFSWKITSFQASRCGHHLAFSEFGPKSMVFSQNQIISGQTVRAPPRVHTISAEIHGFQSKPGHFRPDGAGTTSRSHDFGRNPRFSGKIWSFRARRCGHRLAFTQFWPKSTYFRQNQVSSWPNGAASSPGPVDLQARWGGHGRVGDEPWSGAWAEPDPDTLAVPTFWTPVRAASS